MKNLFLSLFLLLLAACNIPSEQKLEFNPDYNRLARNATVVQKASNFVTYEYKNIRVDELAAVAALYCQDHGDRQAVLHDIQLHPNHSRRATFYCRGAGND